MVVLKFLPLCFLILVIIVYFANAWNNLRIPIIINPELEPPLLNEIGKIAVMLEPAEPVSIGIGSDWAALRKNRDGGYCFSKGSGDTFKAILIKYAFIRMPDKSLLT